MFVDASGWLLCAHQESRDADLELLRKRREEVLGAEHGMPSYSSLPEGNNM